MVKRYHVGHKMHVALWATASRLAREALVLKLGLNE